MGKEATLVSMSGVIIPGFMEENIDILNLVLAIKDEEDYLIANTEKGKELLGHLRKRVRITGKVMIDELGRKVLTVKDYTVMESFN